RTALEAARTRMQSIVEHSGASTRDEMGARLAAATADYVVRRDDGSTIIAGYPWFLDWGRDTLIVLRGLIAASELQTSRDILKTFAVFEDRGTLPNMIRGSDCSNRD